MKKVIVLILLGGLIISIALFNNDHDEKYFVNDQTGLNGRKESTIDFEIQPEISDFSGSELEEYSKAFPTVNSVVLHTKESNDSINFDVNDSKVVGMINYIMYSREIAKYTYCLNPRSNLWVENLLNEVDKYLEILGTGREQFPWVTKVYVADTFVVFMNDSGYNYTFEPYCTYENNKYVVPVLDACGF